MVGREFQTLVAGAPGPARSEASNRPLLRARALARRGALEHADLTIGRGEAVGLAGLLGSGRTETARILFAADRADRGDIELDGARLRARAPRTAIARGLALTPEDRKRDGILPHLSVRENIEVALQSRRGLAPIRSAGRRRALAEQYIRLLGIKSDSPEAPVCTLSGGNQQKVLLARWLATEPRLLILDEPTRGIDIGAKAEILRLVDALRGRGMSILFISSELEEIVRTCQRVTVLRDRRTVAELAGEQVTEDAVLAAIAEHEA
jgi:simple sugar transport system ATP-binding protein